MFKYFTNSNTYQYVHVLPTLVGGYNTTYHSSIRMKPRDVRPIHQPIIRKRLYGTTKTNCRVYKYDIGTWVRISKQRQTFSKSFLPKWIEEVFIIRERRLQREPVYYLRDLKGENITGAFYELEL